MPIHTATNNTFVDTYKSVSFTIDSPSDAVELHWHSLQGDWSRRRYLLDYAVPPMFIAKHWSTLNDDLRMLCITKQCLNLTWLSTIWQALSIEIKHCCLEYQTMTTDFLLKNIPRHDKELYFIICGHQNLDPNYTDHIIGDCDCVTVRIILQRQKIPIRWLRTWSRLALNNTCSKKDVVKILEHKPKEGFVFDDIPLEELPKYLTHDIEGIREGAAIRFDQLTYEGVAL